MQIPIEDDHWLREPEELLLYSAEGRVRSPREFAREHLTLLAPAEATLVAEGLEALVAEPAEFDRPLLRTARYADGERQVPARRGGARSAYLLARSEIKIKGCRPEAATFPHWDLDDRFELHVGTIPFGVMTAEGVMRELLAHCFEHHHGLPRAGRPLAVFEYVSVEDGPLGFALVSQVPGDARLERFIDCDGLTLHDLIRRKRRGLPVGGEVKLRDLDRRALVERKAALLAAYNFGGGFRGLLNSNIGNDVIRDGRLHSICDFDTFRRVSVPAAADRRGIWLFTIHTFIELLKSSLPFVDYLDFDGVARERIHAELADHYRGNGSLFQAYELRFRRCAKDRGWPPDLVSEAINEALATPIAFELLQELIPNSHTARQVKLTSHYTPHY